MKGGYILTRPFAFIGFTFFFALIILNNISSPLVFLVLLISSLLALVFLSIKRFRDKRLLPIVFLVIASSSILLQTVSTSVYKPAEHLIGDNVKIEAVLTDLPISRYGNFYYTLKAKSIDGNESNLKIRLSSTDKLNISPYDKVSLNADKLFLLGDSDSRHEYWKSKGIFLGAYTYSGIEIIVTENKPLNSYILNIRQGVINAINTSLPDEISAVLTGMLLGDTTNIEDSTLNSIRLSGAAHILAVSGLHVSVWSLLLYTILKKSQINPKAVNTLSILFLFFFMAFTGFSPSVIRAGIMLIVIYLGNILSEEADAINSLGFSVLILCIINPFSVMNPSLLLSFSATLGILILYHPISEFFLTPIKNIKLKFLRNSLIAVSTIIACSISVSVFTLPVSAYLFKYTSLIAPITNALILIPAQLAMLLGGLAVFVSIITSFLSNPLFYLSGLLIRIIISVSAFFANLPFSRVSLTNPFYFFLFFSILVIITVLIILKRNLFSRIRIVALISAVVFFFATNLLYLNSSKSFYLTLADVGNGSAIVLTHKNRSAILACGGDYRTEYKINNILKSKGIIHVDLILLPRNYVTEVSYGEELVKTLSPDMVISSTTISLDKGTMASANSVNYTDLCNFIIWDKIEITYINNTNESLLFVSVNNLEMLISFLPSTNSSEYLNTNTNADILISRSDYPNVLDINNFDSIVFSCDESRNALNTELTTYNKKIYTTNTLGDIEIEMKNDKFKIRKAVF